jgi:hypothetical protein
MSKEVAGVLKLELEPGEKLVPNVDGGCKAANQRNDMIETGTGSTCLRILNARWGLVVEFEEEYIEDLDNRLDDPDSFCVSRFRSLEGRPYGSGVFVADLYVRLVAFISEPEFFSWNFTQ